MSELRVEEKAGEWKVENGELKTENHSQHSTVNSLLKKGYKQTEVGVIPEDWESVTLGELAEIRMCKRILSSQTKKTGAIPFFKIGTFGEIPDAYISADLYKKFKEKYSFPSKGDVLISAAGTIGKAVVYDGKPAYFQDSNIVWLELNNKRILNDFLYQYYKVIVWASTEGSTISRLYNGVIRASRIALPSLEEQTAIANALSDVDGLINGLEKLIAKKQAIKTATMQQLLTGRTRLPQFAHHPDGSKKRYKMTELGEVPEDWETIQLRLLAKFIKGAGLPKSDLIDNGAHPCIHYGQLFTTYGPKINQIISTTNINGNIKSEVNDVLMPTSDVTPNGLATASCILESNVILGGDILIIRPIREALNGVYFSYLVIVMRDQVMQLVTGSTVYHLYGSDMAKFMFAQPPIEEQTAIATILSDMDEEIQALQQRLAKTHQIKQGMMQALLTGRTRLIAPASKETP